MKADSNIKADSDFVVAGLMSGTSLDGVDIAFCSFKEHKEKWEYRILEAKTFSYDKNWKHTLGKAHLLQGEELINLDRYYGNFLGDQVNQFISETGIKPQLIASHGHTVFHRPDKGYTFQTGNGINIFVRTGIPVVSDFRSLDVALGGQGAPLVPVGDELLFSDYDSCLNLGGFANISFNRQGKRIAFDICPVNIVLNALANELGQEFDEDGQFGETGKTDKELLNSLNQIGYYKESAPKSLSREWVEDEFLPYLKKSKTSTGDKLSTIYDHIAFQVQKVLTTYSVKNVLITGGGALNKYLAKLLQSESGIEIILPEKIIIQYKEALIFAFLGWLRYHNRTNCLSSVTGAKSDSICGTLNIP